MMDQKMRDNIKNYSNEIITLESFVEAVRTVPGMYIGSKGNPGFKNMIREILQNAMDEMIKKSSPCTRIMISYDERTNTVIVEDNGRGIPFDDIERIFTNQHTGSNYNKKEGEYSSGVHGVGSKVTNALSSSFIVESYILGEARRFEFIDGVPSKEGVIVIPNPENKQGTVITFRPAYDIMGDITLEGSEILDLLRELMPLTNVGNMAVFNCIRKDGNYYTETIVNEDSVVAILIYKTQTPLIAPIMIHEDTGKMKADIAFTYDSNDLSDEPILSFGNLSPTTDGGTHVKGFMDGMYKFFKDYMNKVYLNKKSKLVITNADIRVGLKAVVSVSHLYPVFGGQAKKELTNDDLEGFVKQLVLDGLDAWSRNNPNDLQKVAKYLKDVAEIRVKSDEGRVKLSNNYQSSSLTGLPSKYVPPNGTKDLELIIVEGKSAGGSARQGRCKYRQGIFPIRGKLPNVTTTSMTSLMNNEEIAGLINIIGAGHGRSFDISKVKFTKIINMTDADEDGSHIQTLLLLFFLVFMEPLVKAGKLYKAVPPLYGLKNRNGTYTYFTNKLDFNMYKENLFSKGNEISTLNNRKLTTNEIIDLLNKNTEYVYNLELLSNTYALNPNLVELLLLNRNESFDTIKTLIEKTFRFINVNKENNTLVATGLIDSRYQTFVLNDRVLYDSKEVLNYIDELNNGNIFYNLNGQKTSLYNIMKTFDKLTPSNITRYKGLGEMNPPQLGASTLHPDSNRTLIRYTVEDIKKEIESIRYIQSNKSYLINNLKLKRHEILG